MMTFSWTEVLLLALQVTLCNACDGTFTGSIGEITSPNYPSNYPDGVTCTYNIVPTTTILIRLVFDDFETESGYDFVRVYNSSDLIVSSLTGSRSGTVVTSSTSYRVVLAPDPWTNRKGFKATWGAAPSGTIDPVLNIHTLCPVNMALILVNTTGTPIKVYEKVFLTKTLCVNTCLLLSPCTYAKYEEGDMCTMYEYEGTASLDLTNTFYKN